jgi:general secretion pathway protein M
LDAQLQTMRTLAAETACLQILPRLDGASGRNMLEASVTQALQDKGQLTLIGDRASVTLNAVPADTLVRWLAQVRQNARVKPLEIHLNLNTARNGWDGKVIFLLAPL